MVISYCDVEEKFFELTLSGHGGIIGYDPQAMIVLDEIGISSRHMRLSCQRNSLYIEDLQSLNGTFRNGRMIAEKTEIADGDVVQIGSVLLKFQLLNDLWTVTAKLMDSSLFITEEVNSFDADEFSEDYSTAVTVIASAGLKKSLESGDIQSLKPMLMQNNGCDKAKFSFDDITELGKYHIVKKIGKGGMGVVFLARHKFMNTFRALKVLPPSIREENLEFFERFMREARIASDIRHPNIVGVIDAETDPVNNISYIVMEFIDGGNLRRILKKQKILAELPALLIIKFIADALKGIWERKIIHRDIKPDNIMFTRHGEVKLADLGVAKNQEDDINITRNDMMIGTPAYLSPEQIETPQNTDIRSDIYSLGATLYEMLTGETPYYAKTTYDIVQRMVTEAIVDPRKKNPKISAVTAKLVMKMLHKNPAKRYQTPQALLDALNEMLPRYSVVTIQDIIRAVVFDAEMPAGVSSRLASGIGATAAFLFFSCRQSLAEMFNPAVKAKNKPKNDDTASEKYFSFQIDSEAYSEKKMDFTISVSAAQTYRISYPDGYYKEVKASADGLLKMKNLLPGEYRIHLQNKKNT